MNITENKIDLSTTIIMGILNLTDNSFYDGGNYINTEKAVEQAKKMINEGATIIDIGAQSSKPGSIEIDYHSEIEKIIPVLKSIKNKFPDILVSVDTYRAVVAEESINNGADIINDISAGELDKKMFSIIAKYNVPYIIMHMQGKPQHMQNNPRYNDVTKEILDYFKKKIIKLKEFGIEKIIVDPGFGFGKKIEHNYQLLNNLHELKGLGEPILVGISRKSMIYNLVETNANMALNGTTVLNTLAINRGANIIRVHDVKEAAECIKIVHFLKNS